jgi:hypothetical protein
MNLKYSVHKIYTEIVFISNDICIYSLRPVEQVITEYKISMATATENGIEVFHSPFK